MIDWLFAAAVAAQEVPTPTPCADQYRTFQLQLGEASSTLLTADPARLGQVVLVLAVLVLTLVAITLVWMLWRGRDGLSGLLCETLPSGEPGKASISRLQMIIWNFVVAFAFLYMLATRANVYAAIASILQPEVLVLLGISNGTYVAGKLSGPAQPGDATTATNASGQRGGQPVAAGEAPGQQGLQ